MVHLVPVRFSVHVFIAIAIAYLYHCRISIDKTLFLEVNTLLFKFANRTPFISHYYNPEGLGLFIMFATRSAGLFRFGLRSQRRSFHHFYWQSQSATHNAAKPVEKGIKALMKKYGYAALGVYIGLSIIDLPICYLFVASVGDEKIKEWQKNVKEYFGFGKKQPETEETETPIEAEGFSDKYGSFLTTFAIAYGVHKSLIFIRLPITAAVTPSVIRILRGWGFKIGQTSAKGVIKATKEGIKKEGVKSVLTKKGIKHNIETANQKANYSAIDESKFGLVSETKTRGKKWWNFFL